MLWIMFCPVLLCFRFSYLPYSFRCPSGVVAVRAVCMNMHSEVECVFARSNLLFGAVGQHDGASEPTGMSTVSELRVQLTLILP